MKSKLLLICIFIATLATQALAQKEFQVGQITVINLGDGRLLFRDRGNENPIAGQHRIIDGYRSEYILAEFADGMYNGSYEHFKHNRLTEKGTYKEGRREGAFVEYYSDGTTVKSEKSFKNGKLDGVLKTYFTDSSPESEKGYKEGQEHGKEKRWHYETRKQTVDANYFEGKPDGKQVRHISSNRGDYVEESNFAKGVQTGDFSQVYPDGVVKIKGKYKDGKKDGLWIENHKDGRPERETTYKNGERNSVSKTFFTDGSVEKTFTYSGDKKQGMAKEFHYDTGKLKAEYTYADDRKEGAYKLFYDDGSLREEGRCERGSEVYRKEYYRGGQLKQVSERGARGWETIESYNSDGTQR